MGKTLVIAEKPSVAADLARSLPGTFKKREGYLESDGHVVTWALGHLLTLAEPEEYDPRYKKWRTADLPILPSAFKLKPADARSSKQLALVLKLLRRADVERVVNACDAGREGELIFAYLWQTAGVNKPVERLWISSLTQQAIRDGLSRLRPAAELNRLEQAARSRAEADWLVGMNATRAATVRGRAALGGVVSLGRVQTPTLALLTRRERKIQAFVPEDYWLVGATIATPERASYPGHWFAGETTRLPTAERATAIVGRVRGQPGLVASVERREQTEAPPLLYDLTSLQRDANRRFGFSAARTLRAAQALYEQRKALTYPRTNSRYLTSDLIPRLKPTAQTLVSISQYQAPARYVLGLETLPLRRVVDDARVSDHHAIIPTTAEHAVEQFHPDEQQVFDLVARRFLAVFHPAVRYARTTVVTEVAGETFRTRGRVTLEAGWRGVYGTVPDEPTPAPDDEEERAELPPLAPGQAVRCVEAESEQRTTKPPPRYNEATLLSAMETAGKRIDDETLREAIKDSGLGTPATRAEIIETLLRREYLERTGKELTPTPKGLQVITLLESHPLTSAELTGTWEQRLHGIEQGNDDRRSFMRDIADFTRQTVEQLASLQTGELRPERAELGLCPRCGAQTGSIIRENSKAFGCTSWKSKDEPGCGFVIWKQVAGRTLTPEVVRQLLETGRTSEVLGGFKSRAGKSFRARLLLDPGGQVTFDLPTRPWREGGAEGSGVRGTEAPSVNLAPRKGRSARTRPVAGGGSAASSTTTSRNGSMAPVEPRDAEATARRAPAGSRAREEQAAAQSPPLAGAPRPPAPVVDGVDPAPYLRAAGLEVIDKRPAGALWVVDGDPPSPAVTALRVHGVRLRFAQKGGRLTKHRPAWFMR
jgi:DNA topoisomerase-3